MRGEEFATRLADRYCDLEGGFYGTVFVQHLASFLNAEEREKFLDFIGVDYEEDE